MKKFRDKNKNIIKIINCVYKYIINFHMFYRYRAYFEISYGDDRGKNCGLGSRRSYGFRIASQGRYPCPIIGSGCGERHIFAPTSCIAPSDRG